MAPTRTDRINRLLRNIFFAMAGLLALYAVSFMVFLHAGEQPLWRAKMIWLTMGGAVFFVVAGLRFSPAAKFKIFAVLLCLFLLELLLQATAWLGVLPGVETKLKAPYARVYWTAEGRGNGVRNRFGWYFPPFDLKAPHKVAVIGDSQVEAVEVARTQNQAADLQRLLKERSPDWAVLGLGSHGTCPAYSIEVLDYAWRHFQPEEAIVVVSMGSDVTEASPVLNDIPPDRFLYYELDPSGRLVFNAASAGVRQRFDQSLEFCHRSLWATLPVLINSHCMSLQLADSLRDRWYMRHRMAELVANGNLENGFNPAAFAVNPSSDAQRALRILIAQLQQCKNLCDRHGMKFRVVTIPSFQKAFYDSQRGRDWTTRIGDYDYFKPEWEIIGWARANGVPIVSMGEVIRQKRLDVDEIRSLYFSNGMGHLTPKGHALCAQAIFDGFYSSDNSEKAK